MTDRRRFLVPVGVFALLIIGIGVVAMGPRLWRAFTRLLTYMSMPVYEEPMESDGGYTNVIFLHHSTGRVLIAEGNVRPLLTELGYLFWDHGYNHEGLVRPDGKSAWANYRILDDNTDVDGYARLFAQPVTDPPANAFSRLSGRSNIIKGK